MTPVVLHLLLLFASDAFASNSKLFLREEEFTPRSLELSTEIIRHCNLAQPLHRPVKSFNDAVEVNMQLTAHHFRGIQDDLQTFSVQACLTCSWMHPCAKWNHSTEWADVKYFDMRASNTWTPQMEHINRIDGGFIQNLAPDTTVRVFSDGTCEWTSPAILTSTCELKFAAFPLDKQSCSITIEPWDLAEQTRINKCDLDIKPASFISANEVWKLIAYNATIVRATVPSRSDRATFTFVFKRRYEIYVTTLFIPTYSLLVMQLFSGFMPPEEPERPTFCVTIVLAYSVLQSLIGSITPVTSETPYLVILLASHLLTGVICSLYALVACELARRTASIKVLIDIKFVKIRISLIRLVDLIFYGVICVAVFASNLAIFALMLTTTD